jgi:hypothetical protein
VGHGEKERGNCAFRFPLIEAIEDTPWFKVEGHGGEHSKFLGDLQEPIIQSLSEMPVIDGEYQIDGAINSIVRQRIDKLVLLLKHYRIENTSDPWLFLSLRLACAFVPGLRVVTAPPRKRGRGSVGDALSDAVDAERAKTGLRIAASIDSLKRNDPERWRSCRRAPQECHAPPSPLQWPVVTHNQPPVAL